MRRAARTDENQQAIVEGLIQAGATVQTLAAIGMGCPDLLVGYENKCYLLEVKNPAKPKGDRQLTVEQKKWHKYWRGQKAVVHDLVEAFEVIGI